MGTSMGPTKAWISCSFASPRLARTRITHGATEPNPISRLGSQSFTPPNLRYIYMYTYTNIYMHIYRRLGCVSASDPNRKIGFGFGSCRARGQGEAARVPSLVEAIYCQKRLTPPGPRAGLGFRVFPRCPTSADCRIVDGCPGGCPACPGLSRVVPAVRRFRRLPSSRWLPRWLSRRLPQ